jgi:pyruvate,orthophosphate dikinase
MNKTIYLFGDTQSEGNIEMKNLLGGKGANLAEMCSLGIAVPYGFTITTQQCIQYYKEGRLSDSLKEDIIQAVTKTEKKVGRRFGDEDSFPLLFSVRSGARSSMPGMMDSVLNLGLNNQNYLAIAKETNNLRFALDSYRRFIQMYGNVVLGIDGHEFEITLNDLKLEVNILNDTDLTNEHLQDLISSYNQIIKKHNKILPQEPYEQLFACIEAVFKSWMSNRAIVYRKLHNIPNEWGTAVNVQTMVFGNLNNNSGTGVVFTRNPSNGQKEIYGEYLINAQGEDVVSGVRTPLPITLTLQETLNQKCMQVKMPEIYQQLCNTINTLESHYKDVQDIEFTIENGKLWILQTRNAKRTAKAAVKIAYDLVQERMLTKEQALLTINPESLEQLLHRSIDPVAKKNIIAKGLCASPGCASGQIVLNSKLAQDLARQNKKVILVREETSPEDISGMHASVGILTACGGMTSHAAVIARGLGKPCVSGCNAIEINSNYVKIADLKLQEGEIITIDGSTGEVMLGEVETIETKLTEELIAILAWADEIRKIKIRVNAETEIDCQTAIKFGAEGIGLARTEHMLFNEEKILLFRQMIITQDSAKRTEIINQLGQKQCEDFVKIFTIMDGLPVNIRLLDPPLHEFLPKNDNEIQNLSQQSNMSLDQMKSKLKQLHECNPMLGHRGARLAITSNDICVMQARAIFTAFSLCKKNNININLEIMLPLILDKKELDILADLIKSVKSEVEQEMNQTIKCQIGTMIELPRACIKASEIAETADYFSFGTNDLTQTCLGLSRDDSEKFLDSYIDQGIFPANPFVTLDDGVKEMIDIAIEKSRKVKDIKLGICGEHGGDPKSISFCLSRGFDYVSCSPYRIVIAKVAAAIETIKQNQGVIKL